jgi:hypothetical protein
MQNIYFQVEHEPQGHCPLHLLKKDNRRADQIGVRMNESFVGRATPPATIRDAIEDLEALAHWCDDLMSHAGPPPGPPQPVPQNVS